MWRTSVPKPFEEEKSLIIGKAVGAKCADHPLDTMLYEKELREKMSEASDEILRDRDVALAVLPVRGDWLGMFDVALREDQEVVLAAVGQNGAAIRHAKKLRGDKKFVLQLVRSYPGILPWVVEFQADREVVLEAVKTDCQALYNVSRELRADREVVLTAVQHQARALQCLKEYQDDREVVLEAVRRHGSALQFAGTELRADRELVLEAVRSDFRAMTYAAAELKGDKNFLLLAARSCRDKEQGQQLLEEAMSTLMECEAMVGSSDPIVWDDIYGAFASSLAVPGQLAPVLSTCLSKDEGDQGDFQAEVTLLSGLNFSCPVPCQTRSSSGPRLQDFAERLIEQLQASTEASNDPPKHVFIVFAQSGRDDGSQSQQHFSKPGTTRQSLSQQRSEQEGEGLAVSPREEGEGLIVSPREEGEGLAVSPWDWNRSLSDFLQPRSDC